MFEFDNSLEFINLYSIRIKNNMKPSFISENLIICINDIETLNFLQINKNNNDCSKFCFDKGLKINLKYNICVLYCSEGEYKYEYNNICYEKCPNKTFISKKK